MDVLSFEPVGNYYVTDLQLATFRADRILSKLVDTFTFGTGFPTVHREVPKTRVDP